MNYIMCPVGRVGNDSIRIYQRWVKGLAGIEDFSHLIVVVYLHKARRTKLIMHPKNNKAIPKLGYFATRTPRRTNKIGVSVVRLIQRKGANLMVDGLDVTPGTPVLDIKPYTPRDAVKSFKIPLWVRLLDKEETDPLRRYDQSLSKALCDLARQKKKHPT